MKKEKQAKKGRSAKPHAACCALGRGQLYMEWTEAGVLTRLAVSLDGHPKGEEEHRGTEDPFCGRVKAQVEAYLRGERKTFDLPFQGEGTPFQKAVWKALTEIPYGETRSYAALACSIGRPKACRAVGMAAHRNPIQLIIPCHRLIGADGSLTGYAGGLPLKRHLLQMEKGGEPLMGPAPF